MTSADQQEIDAQIRELADWRGERLQYIRELIKSADPDVVEEVKWRKPSNNMTGVPVWSHRGMICTGEVYKDHLKLTFLKGGQLPDPTGLFTSGVAGGGRRAIDIYENDAISDKDFSELIRSAVKLNLGK